MGTELARRGHQVTFVSPRPDGPLPPGTGIRAVWGPSGSSTLLHLADQATFGFRSTWTTLRPAPGAVVYRPLGGSFGPGVATAHSCHAAWLRDRDRVFGATRKSPLDLMLLAQERWTVRRPSIALTTVSASCAGDLAEFYDVPREKIAVAPPAIDAEQFAPPTEAQRRAAREVFGLTGDRLVVGTVANHAFTRKRVDLAITATALTDSTLLVAGQPDVHDQDYRRQAEQLAADVRFLGVVADMRTFYRALDVFVLPSMHESYGMAVHEAMASGVASVVGAACGVATMLEAGTDALVLFEHDGEALATELRTLMDPAVRTLIATAGTAWAHRRSWSDVVDDLMPSLDAASSSNQTD